jgi:hypothetical protein
VFAGAERNGGSEVTENIIALDAEEMSLIFLDPGMKTRRKEASETQFDAVQPKNKKVQMYPEKQTMEMGRPSSVDGYSSLSP